MGGCLIWYCEEFRIPRETYISGSASLKLERYTIDHIEVTGTSNQFQDVIFKGLFITVFRTKAPRGCLDSISISKFNMAQKFLIFHGFFALLLTLFKVYNCSTI